jgi:hypothetical protein
MNIHMIIPQNRLPFYLFWLFASNVGIVIPYHLLAEISPSYENKIQMQMAISRVRPFLSMNGYEVVVERNIGYKCCRLGK